MSKFGNRPEYSYLAVIGDLRSSRALSDRSDVQLRLEQALRDLNQELADSSLAAGFVVTLGDEFQGLLVSSRAGLDVLLFVESALRGIELRFGLGWGEVSTEFREKALGMDGPCFHRAREALIRGKEEDRWVTVSGFGPDGDRILNGLLALLGGVRDRWTDRQAETVSLVRQARTQKEAAIALGVGPSTVSEALTAALYAPIIEAEAAVAGALALFGDKTEQHKGSAERPNR
jgi:hypothetical protein